MTEPAPPLPRVFCARDLPGSALERLRAKATLRVWPRPGPPPREVLLAEAAACSGLLVLLTDRIDRALLDASPGLKVVSNYAVGVDNIDLEACSARGIPVGHTPGVLTETTADLAFALLLAASRRVVEADAFVRAGRWKTWEPNLLLGRDVHGATLGIAGLGAIGQAVARRALGFGMKILYFNRSPRPEAEATLGVQRVDKAELLARSEFLTLHLPYGPETRHFLGAAELESMRSGAVLVNTARGGLVDQGALRRSLEGGKLFAAGLDVAEEEPFPLDEPLLRLPNVVLAPHIGSASVATREQMAHRAVDNLLAGLEGQPLRSCANAAGLLGLAARGPSGDRAEP